MVILLAGGERGVLLYCYSVGGRGAGGIVILLARMRPGVLLYCWRCGIGDCSLSQRKCSKFGVNSFSCKVCVKWILGLFKTLCLLFKTQRPRRHANLLAVLRCQGRRGRPQSIRCQAITLCSSADSYVCKTAGNAGSAEKSIAAPLHKQHPAMRPFLCGPLRTLRLKKHRRRGAPQGKAAYLSGSKLGGGHTFLNNLFSVNNNTLPLLPTNIAGEATI